MRFRLLLALAAAFTMAGHGAELNFAPMKPNGVYALGETVGWTVTPAGGATTAGKYAYTVRTNQFETIGSGNIDLASGSAAIAVSIDHPAMLYVTVDRVGTPPAPSREEVAKINASLKSLLVKNDPTLKSVFDKYPDYCVGPSPCTPALPENVPMPPPEPHLALLGAAVAPTKLVPTAARPADFDAFWAEKLAALRKVPMRPILTPMASAIPGVKMYIVQLDSLGSRVHGYLAVPTKKGPHPAMIAYQWAGVYALQPSICANRAAEGWLCFNVDSHDLPPDQANGVPKNYPEIGNTSRETSYFLSMYLRDTRALDWVRTLPSWNKKTLVVTGTSMGGHQSLVTAGLNPGKITAVVVNEPSGADSNAELHGRKAGYPNWPVSDPRVAKAALYFDTVNFASKITAPTLAAIGFIDQVCPPAGIWTAVNQIPAPKEVIPMYESDHNNITPDKQGAFLQRSEEVFAILLSGGKFVPDQSVARGP
jgi:cephalosporin-C deacetylase-like acetyl esterase